MQRYRGELKGLASLVRQAGEEARRLDRAAEEMMARAERG